MIVKAVVLSVVKRMHKDKEVADVVLMLSDPTEAVTVTLWNNSIQRGEEKPYERLTGQEAFVPLSCEVFRDKLQYRLKSDVLPQPVKQPTAAPAPGKAA